MIVRASGSDLLLIRQPDHAALAGRLMTAWRADHFPTRPTRARVLDATSRHDIGWDGEDTEPRVNPSTGAPYDFVSAPLTLRQGVWPRALDRLAPEDPYVAALVAQHALTVYRRYAHDPEWRDFFRTMERRRDDLFASPAPAGRDVPFGLDSFLQDYVIVGLGDLFSLIFCNGWPEPYLMESYQAILHGDRLQIAPDPFDGASVPLDVEAWRIPARAYVSDADLRATLAEAPTVRLTGVAIGAPLPSIT
jgi:hypothetical protein